MGYRPGLAVALEDVVRLSVQRVAQRDLEQPFRRDDLAAEPDHLALVALRRILERPRGHHPVRVLAFLTRFERVHLHKKNPLLSIPISFDSIIRR